MKQRPFGDGIEDEEIRAKLEGGHLQAIQATGGVTARTKKKDHKGKAFA